MNALSKFLMKYLPRCCFNRSTCICYARNIDDLICLYSFNPYTKKLLISDPYLLDYQLISLDQFKKNHFTIITDFSKLPDIINKYDNDLPF